MDAYLDHLQSYLLTQTWQLAIVFVVAAVVTAWLRRRSAHIRYGLWLIVLAKALIPPIFTVPLPVFTESVMLSMAVAPSADETTVAESSSSIHFADTTSGDSASAIASSSAASRVSSSAIASHFSRAQWFALVWLMGLTIFLVVGLSRVLLAQRRLMRHRRLADADTRVDVELLSASLGLIHIPNVYLIDGISQPFVWGVIRGSIYLPANFAATTVADHRRSVLLHELAHVARCDAFINTLQIVAQAIFFFHPLMWIANAMIRCEREKCCDETAVAHLGTSPKSYGHAIVETLVREYDHADRIPSLAVAGPAKNIEDRIKTLMTPNRQFYLRPSRMTLATLLILCAVTAPMAYVFTPRASAENGSTPTADVSSSAASATPTSIASLLPTTSQPAATATTSSKASSEEALPKNFSATLDDGTKVTLLGVSEHPSVGKKWWKPDSSGSADAPPASYPRNCSVGGSANQRAYEIAARVTSPKPDVSATWNCSNGSSSESSADPMSTLYAIVPLVEADVSSTSLRCGIASGPWTTLAEAIGDRASAVTRTDDQSGSNGICFADPIDDDRGCKVIVAHQVSDCSYRVVAVKKGTGEQIVATGAGVGGANGLMQMTCRFAGLSSKDVANVLFQTRPYRWIIFGNISLSPDKRTNPTVVVCPPEWTPADRPSAKQHILREAAGVTLCKTKLIPACEGEMARVRERAADGNPWKDKIDLNEVYRTWADENKISLPDKQAALKIVEGYLAEHADDVEYGWRVNYLLATIAEDINNDDAADGYLAAAMTLYPTVDYAEPAKQSKYQHILNSRARILSKTSPTKKFDTAEAFAIKRLQSDPKCDYVFLFPWIDEYQKAGQASRLSAFVQKLRDSYDVRAKNFPAKADMCRRYKQELNRLPVPVASSAMPHSDVPRIIATNPIAFADDVPASLSRITVTFDQPMMNGSWSWTGGGETYPRTTGKPRYNAKRTVCTLPVKLQPGKVYWIGINSPSHKNFKTTSYVPVKWYVILFATKGTDGRPTPIPDDLLQQARDINADSGSTPAAESLHAMSSRASHSDKD